MSSINTKDKILQIAHRLFSEKGFNGVGIREISREAGVNVAAINYHFQNKDTLYFQTLKKCFEDTAHNIQSLYEKDKGQRPEDLILAIFDFFTDNKEDLVTSFKLFIGNSDHVELDESATLDDSERQIGPPGGMTLFECLKHHVVNADDNDIAWAVRTLMAQVLHKSVIYCNHCSKLSKKDGFSLEDFKRELNRFVKVIVKEITAPEYPFE